MPLTSLPKCVFYFLIFLCSNLSFAQSIDFKTLDITEVHESIDSLFKQKAFSTLNAALLELDLTIEKEVSDKSKLNLSKFLIEKNSKNLTSDVSVHTLNQIIENCSKKEGDENDVLATAYYLLGKEYYESQNFPFALEFYLKSERFFKEKCNYTSNELYWSLAKGYFDFRDHETCLNYLNIALQCDELDYILKINLLNTKALILTSQQNFNESKKYFIEALAIANELPDSAWIGILNGNIGYNFHSIGMMEEAKPLIEVDYKLSTKHRQWNSAFNALNIIIDIEMKKEPIDFNYLDSLFTAAENMLIHEIDGKARNKYLHNKAAFNFLKKNFDLAYSFQLKAYNLQDSLFAEQDLITVKKAEIKSEAENHLAQLNSIERERKQEIIIRNTIIGLALLAIIILFLIIRLSITKRIEEKKRLELLQKSTSDQLENAKQLLTNYIKSAKEKNSLIAKFQNELELKEPSGEARVNKELLMSQLYESSILTEDDWIEFKRIFERAHPGFFQKLQYYRKDLTTSEMRFLSLLKLGLEINEMAAMLGISPNSVRRTRLRLKTKLELDDVNDLIKFLNRVV